MKVHATGPQWALVQGDVEHVCPELPQGYFDAVLCDPPYGLSFMAKGWDYQVPSIALWRAVLGCLKPGAPILAFGGTRTYHRLVVNLEDAGAEIRDQLAYLYGTGFPKSANPGCECDKAKTEHDVRSVSESDVPQAFDAADQSRQVLQPGMPQQSAHADGPEGAESEAAGRSQPRMEGRRDVQAEQGQLHRAEVRSMPAGSAGDGTSGRLRDGASAGHGADARAFVDPFGGRAPQGPRHAEQRTGEPGMVPEQRSTQESRRPGSACSTCGKSVGWQGYGTALKPAQEPIVLARKPLAGTMAANIAAHGCGPLAIDACRIDLQGESTKRDTGTAAHWGNAGRVIGGSDVGRWPANVLLDEDAAEVLDAQSGTTHTHGGKVTKKHAGMGYMGGPGSEREVLASSGGASRFFYTAKASRSEREAGLDAFPVLSGGEMTDREDGSAALNSPRTGAGRGGGRRNPHPTVKPIALMRYLARLVRPAGPTRRILVPFAGVGSEMIAACLEGFDEVIGIELGEEHPEYLDIAAARLAHWTAPSKRV